MPKGTVVKIVRSKYLVNLAGDGRDVSAILPGKYKQKLKSTHSIVNVGDVVDVFSSGTDWLIEKIHPRKNKISRISPQNRNEERILVTNVDQMLIVSSAKHPSVNPRLIDRYLVTAMKYGISPHIILSKTDLIEDGSSLISDLKKRYKNSGNRVTLFTVTQKNKKDKIAKLIKDKVNVVVGSSGVGKSSIITFLDEKLNDIRIGRVSKSQNKGTHTTTSIQMFYLPEFNAYIVDTPGIREFGLYGIEKEELCHYFPDLQKFAEKCKFHNCQHLLEPDCAIKNAVKDGNIDPDRYVSYKNIYSSIENENKRY